MQADYGFDTSVRGKSYEQRIECLAALRETVDQETCAAVVDALNPIVEELRSALGKTREELVRFFACMFLRNIPRVRELTCSLACARQFESSPRIVRSGCDRSPKPSYDFVHKPMLVVCGQRDKCPPKSGERWTLSGPKALGRNAGCSLLPRPHGLSPLRGTPGRSPDDLKRKHGAQESEGHLRRGEDGLDDVIVRRLVFRRAHSSKTGVVHAPRQLPNAVLKPSLCHGSVGPTRGPPK